MSSEREIEMKGSNLCIFPFPMSFAVMQSKITSVKPFFNDVTKRYWGLFSTKVTKNLIIFYHDIITSS